MYGAIIGDTVGSIYEWNNLKSKDFPLFQKYCFPTDDSFLTVAVAKACLSWAEHKDLEQFRDELVIEFKRIGHLYPGKGYGGRFADWLWSDSYDPYNSCGNGSAMRVSPCAYAGSTLAEVEALAEASADVTHNHPDGIAGAKATAAAIYLARSGCSRKEIRTYISENYYPLNRTLREIRPTYRFKGTCKGTVPEAIEAFLESCSFEDAIRNAISLGGDSDTLACITGSIAEAYYGIPEKHRTAVKKFIKRDMREFEQETIRTFYKRFSDRFFEYWWCEMAKDEWLADDYYAQLHPLGVEERAIWKHYQNVPHKRRPVYGGRMPRSSADPAVVAIKGIWIPEKKEENV